MSLEGREGGRGRREGGWEREVGRAGGMLGREGGRDGGREGGGREGGDGGSKRREGREGREEGEGGGGEGGEGRLGREGGEGRLGREGGREGGRKGREGGRGDCYTYSNIIMQFNEQSRHVLRNNASRCLRRTTMVRNYVRHHVGQPESQINSQTLVYKQVMSIPV